MKPLQNLFLSALILLASCKTEKNNFDATGAFETEEIIISAEASGTINQFNIAEGQTLNARQIIGSIDSTQLYLKKLQLEAQIKATLSQKPDIASQQASLVEQLNAAKVDQQRIVNLIKANAATKKQLDDINSRVDVLQKQIDAQQTSLNILSGSITQQTAPLQVQIEQINDQLSKCVLINPVNGTVLTKYAEVNELAVTGKPLYKIADLSYLFLRAYITGDQFSEIKLNQKVKVFTDSGADASKEYEGTVTWISDKAEFTPKTIQTKDDRANLVYAVKVKVVNDGLLKIGMYGEMKFH